MSRWLKAVDVALGKNVKEIPVVLWAYSLILKRFEKVKESVFYNDVKLQLRSKLAFQQRFPEAINLGMGMYPESGESIAAIASAFGGKITWMDDAPPHVSDPPVKKLEDIDRLVSAGVPEANSGIVEKLMKGLEYFCDWFPNDLREEYGYINGVILGPIAVEGAAMAMGYDKFLIGMWRYPDLIHKWLDLTTEWYLRYCKALEEIVGKCTLLIVPDHTPHMVNKEQFNEFILPYLNRIFARYKGALRIWHNEGSVGRKLEDIDKIDAEVWHFGPFDNESEVRTKTHFCLMGNIHPPEFEKCTSEEVAIKCNDLVKNTGVGKLWLSTGGGIAPNTPFSNIDALIASAKKYEGIYAERLYRSARAKLEFNAFTFTFFL